MKQVDFLTNEHLELLHSFYEENFKNQKINYGRVSTSLIGHILYKVSPTLSIISNSIGRYTTIQIVATSQQEVSDVNDATTLMKKSIRDYGNLLKKKRALPVHVLSQALSTRDNAISHYQRSLHERYAAFEYAAMLNGVNLSCTKHSSC